MDLRIFKHIKYNMEDPSEIVNDKYEIYNADCLEHMKLMADDSVDLIFCDLPYAQTDCHWDTAIDMDLFWKQVMRIKKLNTPIFMTTTTKFGVSLIQSAPKKCPFRYDIVWHKSKKVGFLSARKMPLRSHEMIYVFYERLPFYDLSSHTHKFIKKKTSINNIKINGSNTIDCYGMDKKSYKTREERIYDPPLPNSIVSDGSVKSESGTIYGAVKTPDSIVTHKTIYGEMPQTEQYAESVGADPKGCHKQRYDPPLPDSIIQAEYKNTTYGDIKMVDFKARKKGESRYDPPLPDSVVKSDCYEKNKTDDSLRKGYRDKRYDPPLPDSVVKEKYVRKGVYANRSKNGETSQSYDPPLPDSVVKETYDGVYGKIIEQVDIKYRKMGRKGNESTYDPPLPNSIVKEDIQLNKERKSIYKKNKELRKKEERGITYDPPLPVSIVKEPEPVKPKSKASEHPVGYVETGYIVKVNKGGRNYWTKNKEVKPNIEPKVYVPPAMREPPKDVYNFKNRVESGQMEVSHNSYDPQLPDSMLYVKSESGKHSTQKPVALMNWILKYYSKEGDVVFDPTCGSGSTGVSCMEMNRKFIGCEMDKKIFKDAINRLSI